MTDFYQKTADEALEMFNSDKKSGLTTEEAHERLEEYGPNSITQQKSKSAWDLLWHNLNNLIVYLLLAAAILSFAMGETVEGIAVLIAVALAVLTGFFTELKAQKSVDSLQSMIYTTSKVIRDGDVEQIKSSELVPGDIMVLEEGDAIAADGRIITSRNFACIESALTGESEAVEKSWRETYDDEIPLGDRRNVVFAGTAVTRGSAYVVVTETAMKTEVGKISGMLTNSGGDKTPLDLELDKLGKALIIAALIAGIAVLIAGTLTNQPFTEMAHISIILAVAAIPEAMPAVSTITLSRGMKTMAEHKALVKSLSAVETLGSTSIICSDKTGTLTENQMTVVEVVLANGDHFEVSGNGYEPVGSIEKDGKEIDPNDNEDLIELIRDGVLCNTAQLKQSDDQYDIVGDPTDGALVVLGAKVGLRRRHLEEDNWEKVAELPFDSENKFMVSVYDHDNGKRTLIMKGAPDVLMNLSVHTDETYQKWQSANEEIAANGHRVIAIASISDYQGSIEDTELKDSLDNLSLNGLVGIIDPPRTDVFDSIALSQAAGIQVKMITGDHPKTASIIARDIGLKNYEKTMTGREIDHAVDTPEFEEQVRETAVFARVSPENKLQIVRALREQGEVVAMTGDGVNDAPALNGADIGVAMGIRGTEVAKESSDMILTDDRFGTIVDAIKEGRIIFDNIKKYVAFLFSCNMVEIITILLSVVFLLPMPIQPLHILFLNLVIDIAPAMSLAFEPAEANLMERNPRSRSESLVNKRFLGRIILSGSVIGLTAFGLFTVLMANNYQLIYAQTATFTFMAIAQLMHIFNVRKQNSFGFDKSLFKNRALVFALLLSVVLQMLAVYLPFMNAVLGTAPIGLITWVAIFVAAAISTIVVMLLKKVINFN